MPLYYRKDNSNYAIYYYDNLSDLNGPDVDSEHYLMIRVGGINRYIGLTTNFSHIELSHMRVQIDGTTYGVLHRSKYEAITIEKTDAGESTSFTIPSNANNITSTMKMCGGKAGNRGAGGGGGGAKSMLRFSHSFAETGTAIIIAVAGGSGGSGGTYSADPEITETNPILEAGKEYRLNIGDGTSGTSGAGGGGGGSDSGFTSGRPPSGYVPPRAYGGHGGCASSPSIAQNSYLEINDPDWTPIHTSTGSNTTICSNRRDRNYRREIWSGSGNPSSERAEAYGGHGGYGQSVGNYGAAGGAQNGGGNGYWVPTESGHHNGGSGGLSGGSRGGAGGSARCCWNTFSHPSSTGGTYYTYDSYGYANTGGTGESGASGTSGCGCINVSYWLTGA